MTKSWKQYYKFRMKAPRYQQIARARKLLPAYSLMSDDDHKDIYLYSKEMSKPESKAHRLCGAYFEFLRRKHKWLNRWGEREYTDYEASSMVHLASSSWDVHPRNLICLLGLEGKLPMDMKVQGMSVQVTVNKFNKYRGGKRDGAKESETPGGEAS